jgi:hypothetical protein
MAYIWTLEGWQFVLITRDSKTVHRNVRDRRDKNEEPSGVRIVSRFRIAVDLKKLI